jgi:hypothetical protein
MIAVTLQSATMMMGTAAENHVRRTAAQTNSGMECAIRSAILSAVSTTTTTALKLS